jgi:Glycosyltransferase family 87
MNTPRAGRRKNNEIPQGRQSGAAKPTLICAGMTAEFVHSPREEHIIESLNQLWRYISSPAKAVFLLTPNRHASRVMQRKSLFRGWIATHVLSIVAVSIVAGSVFFSGVARHGGAKDVDARYFYIAAKCWAAGQSPYVTQIFSSRYRETFGVAPASFFSGYPPTLMVIVLPMALFQWPVAARLFSLANFAAAMVLFWACYRLVREQLGHRLRPSHWFWVILASTLGGVAGTIFTGQTSVFVAAAVAIALVGSRCQRSWLTVVGFTIASAKPHLSAPALLLIPWLEPGQRSATLIGVGIAVGLSAYAVAIDPDFVHSFLSSMNHYNSVAENDPVNEFGLVPMLLRFGIGHGVAGMIGLACAVLMLGEIVWFVRRSGKTLSSVPLALMLMMFSVAVALPIHFYDLCCYATGIALIATLTWRYQIALCVPALLLWRPVLTKKLNAIAVPNELVQIVAWLSLLICSAVIVAVRLRSGRTPTGETVESKEPGSPGLEAAEVEL